jgi:ABC-2 type transport system ATP-binding protein
LADAAPAELAKVMQLANLQDVFAQLVQQEDTRVLARQLVEVMGVGDA